MKETGFSDIGRIEAIRLLFEESPFKNERIKTEITDGFAVTSGKMLLEGIDFNLVYFPLKHLGYKSVIAVTGEIYASMATPKKRTLYQHLRSWRSFFKNYFQPADAKNERPYLHLRQPWSRIPWHAGPGKRP